MICTDHQSCLPEAFSIALSCYLTSLTCPYLVPAADTEMGYQKVDGFVGHRLATAAVDCDPA